MASPPLANDSAVSREPSVARYCPEQEPRDLVIEIVRRYPESKIMPRLERAVLTATGTCPDPSWGRCHRITPERMTELWALIKRADGLRRVDAVHPVDDAGRWIFMGWPSEDVQLGHCQLSDTTARPTVPEDRGRFDAAFSALAQATRP